MNQLTPKKEAIQLVKQFSPLVTTWDCYWDCPRNADEITKDAKECAIICVNKIIESHTDNLNGDNIKQKEHYQQVLQEISKL